MSMSVIDSEIDSAAADRPLGLTEVAIPGGLWLRSGAGRGDEQLLPGFCITANDARFTVLVGRPGESLPMLTAVAEVVRALAAPLRERMVLTVYGAEPGPGRCLAQRLADVLGSSVRANHGVLLKDADGIPNRFAVGQNDEPTWQPFAQLSTYEPGGTGATGRLWKAPTPSAVTLGPGRYRLTVDWTIDVVPAGLVVRPAAAPSRPVLSCAPTDPDRVDLIIDDPDGRGLTDDMLTALGRFADALPSAARARARLVLMPGLPALSARALRWAVPAPVETWADPASVRAPVLRPALASAPNRLEPVPVVEDELEPELETALVEEAETAPIGVGAHDRPKAVDGGLAPLPAARLVTSLVVGRSGRMFLV